MNKGPNDLASRTARQPLGETVFCTLRDAIRSGRYRPGDRLREEEVAQALNVSRTPVREALGRLMATGMVVPTGGRGVIVRSLDIAEALELYAMREILEGAAARLAALQASMPEIDALRDLEEGFEARSGDPSEMARINRMFHEAIFRGARNRYLDRALAELQDGIALLGNTTFSIEQRPSTAAVEHRAIIDAIARRDADGAEQAARHHIQEALRQRLRLMNAARTLPDQGTSERQVR